MAKNMVIAGLYEGSKVIWSIGLTGKETVFIEVRKGWKIEKCFLNRENIENIVNVDEDSRKSGTSAVARAAAGGVLLGPIGLAAGLSAKNKKEYTLDILFKDETKSLITVDEKIYKYLVKEMY